MKIKVIPDFEYDVDICSSCMNRFKSFVLESRDEKTLEGKGGD